jgi:hypothetical protein
MQSQNELRALMIVLAALLPFVYGFLILWAFEHRCRMTTRYLLIATAFIALAMGIIVAAF